MSTADKDVQPMHSIQVPLSGGPEPEIDLLEGVTPLVRKSHEAFVRSLPSLLQTNPRQWVAFSGERQLGIDAKSKTRLAQDLFRQGYKLIDFVIFRIEPQYPPELDHVPDV
ncbi:MAG: hypothetical protein HYS13_03085 [Planctomycetia bacterium]|nr:hypothetical protein [Planctomycetia bacterium]